MTVGRLKKILSNLKDDSPVTVRGKHIYHVQVTHWDDDLDSNSAEAVVDIETVIEVEEK